MADKSKDSGGTKPPPKDKTATIDLSHTSQKGAGEKGETKERKSLQG
ncbi:MAG: hypothetical protein M3O89_04755 [Actinomycetota bacterium]|nr:hypothetical protein [Actinomycetota bacterium]